MEILYQTRILFVSFISFLSEIAEFEKDTNSTMAGKSSDSSLTTYLWNNLNNAQIDIQLLKNFELNDEETARKKFGQAIKNIKGRKKYNAKTMKSLLNKVNADLKEVGFMSM